MGRFATSLVAFSVVLCTLPLEQLRLYAMQEGDKPEVASSATDAGTAETSTSGSEAAPAASDASQAAAETEKPATASSETPANPASPTTPATLNGNSSSNAANGNAVANRSSAAGDGDGSSPPSKGNVEAPSMGPSNIPFQVTASPDGALKKEPSFTEFFFANPLNLVLLAFVALYVFLLFGPKPGAKERKLQQQRLASLKKNDRVVLTSGIHGIVSNINTEAGTVTVRVDESSNAKITVERSAIRSVEA